MSNEFELRQINPTNTAAEWITINPILLKSELGFESDTGLYKIGDGIHNWNDLPYSTSAINELIAGQGIIIHSRQIGARLLYEVVEL